MKHLEIVYKGYSIIPYYNGYSVEYENGSFWAKNPEEVMNFIDLLRSNNENK